MYELVGKDCVAEAAEEETGAFVTVSDVVETGAAESVVVDVSFLVGAVAPDFESDTFSSVVGNSSSSRTFFFGS